MDVTALESWLWDAACAIRGPVDAPKFKDYILPLVFLKRLSDVFEEEIELLGREFGDRATALDLAQDDHALVRFYIPRIARWSSLAKTSTGLGETLTDAVRAVARENAQLQGVIDIVDFNATTAGQRIVGDDRLKTLIQILSRHRLGMQDVEPDILGRAYEYLLRKFAEGQGQSAGEFYTPREVARLMAEVLSPEPGMSVYDPACGSGGLLIKCHLYLLANHGEERNGAQRLPSGLEPLHLYGQEINPSTFAMARMNSFIHDMAADIRLGDTMGQPRFTTDDGALRQFDIVTANPMWNQDFDTTVLKNDPYERFSWGVPPASTGDWGWVQHMNESLRPDGRIAVVLDTGAVARGSGSRSRNRERDIRARFVEEDLTECVILLPENLFYNTTAAGIVLILNRRKRHPGEILLVNASTHFEKVRPKNRITSDHVDRTVAAYRDWKEIEEFSATISIEEAREHDYNLSPSRYIRTGTLPDVLSPEDAHVLLREVEEERQLVDEHLKSVLDEIGLKS